MRRWLRRCLLCAPTAQLLALAGPAAAGGPVRPAATVPPVVLIVMENEPYSNIVGNPNAPYLNGTLIPGGLLETDYLAGPGSLPDYLAMTAGITAVDPLAPNLFAALGSGQSWREYEESMPSACYQPGRAGLIDGTRVPLYTNYHNPAEQFTDVLDSGLCANVVPLDSSFSAADLPAFSYVVPNECNDMHTRPRNGRCPMWNGQTNTASNLVAMGDNWLRAFVPLVAGSATVIVTWDEGTPSDEQVVTVQYGAGVTPGSADATPYTHFSLEAGLYAYFGLGPAPGAGAAATPLPIGSTAGSPAGAVTVGDGDHLAP